MYIYKKKTKSGVLHFIKYQKDSVKDFQSIYNMYK